VLQLNTATLKIEVILETMENLVEVTEGENAKIQTA